MALADFQTLVDSLLRDIEDDISDTERDSAISRAVLHYSKDRPRSVVEDLLGKGSCYLDLPACWTQGFSSIELLEYPVGNNPPTYLRNWRMYNAPGQTQVMNDYSIDTDDTVRATVKALHTLDGVTDTTPVFDQEAIASYAAASLFDQLAAAHAGDQDSTIQSDSVDHGDMARKYRANAKALRVRYNDLMKVKPGAPKPAGAIVDLDRASSRGRDRLTHRGRNR